MRRTILAAAAVGGLMALALPAQAKVEGTANISGPGLGGGGGGGGTIRVDGSDGGGWAAFSGLLDTGRVGADRAPTDELGPRYKVVLDVRQPAQANDVVQYLYPYAEGEAGPLIYTPPGQRILDFDAPSGWWGAPADLMDVLWDSGLPRENPVPAGAGPVADPTAATEAPGIAPALWAIAALASLLLTGAVAARRRAARAPAG